MKACTSPKIDERIRPPFRWLLLFWMAFASYNLLQQVVYSRLVDRPVAWVALASIFFSSAAAWAILCYVIQGHLIHWRLSGPGWKRNLAKTVSLGLLTAPLHRILNLLLTSLVLYFRDPKLGLFSYFRMNQVLSGSFDSLLTFLIIAGAYQGIVHYREARFQKLRAGELENQLNRARLDALKAQLQPHFLFNCLNTISALMEENVARAQAVMTRLGELLRRSLDTPPEQSVTLERELDFIRQYLAIEKARFEDRLQLVLDLAPATLEARVPPFLLQPLVENAVRHAVSEESPGAVALRTRLQDRQVVIEIEDTGPGLPGDVNGFFREGIGLSNTRKRLFQFFGKDCLEFENGSSGLIARITIPFFLHEDRQSSDR